MSWWLDLSDAPLHAVQLIEAVPRHVAVWLSPTSVDFYAEDSGVHFGTLDIVPPGNFEPSSDEWRRYVDSLRFAPSIHINPVDLNGVSVLVSYDGRLRVYWARPQLLLLESDGQQVVLTYDDESPLIAVGLDSDLGTVAALSESAVLYFYQQHVYVGRYELFDISLDGLPRVFLPDAAGVAVVIHDSGALRVDLSGRVRARLPVSAANDVAACAPGGHLLVLGERHSGVLRVYNADLTLLHQGRARDMLEAAQPLQLMPRLPSEHALLNSVVVADDGALVFALDGCVCCSYISVLPELPHPRALL